jgi:aromatic-L-amino-acid decarboxylase
MNKNEFRKHAHIMVDWMADYLENVETYPVKSPVHPKEILQKLQENPPERGEPFEKIFDDFQKVILPGITHWQHPSFFAYFPANTSPPSILAEMLTATLACQCMSWQTSPSATELEEEMMLWLRKMLGLPEEFIGVIQDSASSATLCSLLTAREKKSDFRINRFGYSQATKYATYSSLEAHSSIEKAVKISGIGSENLRKIAVDDRQAMNPNDLELAILNDIENGLVPLWVVVAIGTTGSTAIDSLRKIGEICKKYRIWLHVDAAYAGSALILPEMRYLIDGIELADSFVFNPHKWLFTNFDCSAYFMKDKESLLKTFEILPEYLKTKEDADVNNYRDWGIPLGRRFRALKLWFVIRSYGIDGLQSKIRFHIEMAQDLAKKISESKEFEILAPVILNAICFRYHPEHIHNPEKLDKLNKNLLEALNNTGKIYLTHTKLKGIYTLRLVIGQTEVQQHHVDAAWALIQILAHELKE